MAGANGADRSAEELARGGPAGQWSSQVLGHIDSLRRTMGSHPARAAAVIRQLGRSVDQTLGLAVRINDKTLARHLRKTGLALGRRVEVWRRILPLYGLGATDTTAARPDATALLECLTAVSAAIGESAEGAGLARVSVYRGSPPVRSAHAAGLRSGNAAGCERALLRLTQTPWTASQRRFVSSPAIAELREALWPWAAEPIGAAAVLRNIERYETTELPSDANRLAIDCQFLMASPASARASWAW